MTIVGHLFQLNTDCLSAAGDAAAALAAAPAKEVLTATDSTQQHERPTARQLPLPEQGPSVLDTQPARWNQSGATCIACGIGITLPGFESAAEQREHFRTDWHRYNVKRRLRNQAPASEEQFAALIKDHEDEVSSISGSSSGSEGSDEEGDEGAKAPAHEAFQLTNQLPQFVFQAADSRYFAVWRCLLFPDHALRGATASAISDSALQLANLRSVVSTPSPLWVVLMLRGGHFAAAVLKGKPAAAGARTLGAPATAAGGDVGARGSTGAGGAAGAGPSGRQQPVSEDLPFEVVVSKTFHRYVVRAKAGGKQSTKDGTGKYAKSAGSRLRRYNELALERDIQELLASWSSHLAAAQLVFVHAPSSNSKAVYGTGSAAKDTPASPLLASDPRVRRVPFLTQRPTFSEVKRVARLLSSVFEVPAEQVVRPGEVAAALEEEARSKAQQRAQAAAAAAAAKVATGAHQQEQAAGSGNDAAAAGAPSQPAGRTMPLHRAAKAGDPDRVAHLLASGHDPTQRDEQGRTPYALSADKAVRDAFRRYMAGQPEQWDYGAAEVPSALTEELESAQQAKKAEKKAKLKAKEKERRAGDEERKKAAAEAAAEAMEKEIALAAAEAAALAAKMGNMRTAQPAPSKVGGAGSSRTAGGAAASRATPAAKGKAAAQQRQQQQQQQQPPTPEEMARRRETMAAAAEARMRAMQQQAQQQQLW